jgi:hypothetical protein
MSKRERPVVDAADSPPNPRGMVNAPCYKVGDIIMADSIPYLGGPVRVVAIVFSR